MESRIQSFHPFSQYFAPILARCSSWVRTAVNLQNEQKVFWDPMWIINFSIFVFVWKRHFSCHVWNSWDFSSTSSIKMVTLQREVPKRYVVLFVQHPGFFQEDSHTCSPSSRNLDGKPHCHYLLYLQHLVTNIPTNKRKDVVPGKP